jgi:hypothetical protein
MIIFAWSILTRSQEYGKQFRGWQVRNINFELLEVVMIYIYVKEALLNMCFFHVWSQARYIDKYESWCSYMRKFLCFGFIIYAVQWRGGMIFKIYQTWPRSPSFKIKCPMNKCLSICTMYLIPKCPKGLFSTIFWDFEVMHRLSLSGLYICIDVSYLLIVHNFVERRNIVSPIMCPHFDLTLGMPKS